MAYESKYGFINPQEFRGQAKTKAQEIDDTIKDILKDLWMTLGSAGAPRISGPIEDTTTDVEQWKWQLKEASSELTVTLSMELNGTFFIDVRPSYTKSTFSPTPDFVYQFFDLNARLVKAAIDENTDPDSPVE